MLIAIVMLVAAIFVGGDRSIALLVTGLALGSLAGLELSIREHFAGYRSHTALLAGAAGSPCSRCFSTSSPICSPRPARLAVGLLVAAAAAWWLARAFRDRSGRT